MLRYRVRGFGVRFIFVRTCREVILQDCVLVESFITVKAGMQSKWLEPRNKSSVFVILSLSHTLTQCLLLLAIIALFHIATYTIVPLLLILILLLVSLLQIVFYSVLFAINLQPSPIHPPLGDLQVRDVPRANVYSVLVRLGLVSEEMVFG